MLAFEVVLTLLVTLILSTALSMVYANDGLGTVSSFWFFFVILFFSVWAGGLWLAPTGPELFNVYWLNFIWAGLMVSLLISTIIAPRQAYLEALKKFHLKSSQLSFGIEAGSVFNLSFWVLILLLFAGILSHYIYI